MKNVIAFEHSDYFSFNESSHTDTAIFIRFSDFHFLYFREVESQAHYLFL